MVKKTNKQIIEELETKNNELMEKISKWGSIRRQIRSAGIRIIKTVECAESFEELTTENIVAADGYQAQRVTKHKTLLHGHTYFKVETRFDGFIRVTRDNFKKCDTQISKDVNIEW